MEELIVFTPFFFLLFYLQVTPEAHVPPPTKVGQFCGSKLSVILNAVKSLKNHWDVIADYAQIAVSGTRTSGQRRSAVRCSTCRIGTHAVMTLPDKLRPVLKEDRKLWKVVMDSAIKALNDNSSPHY